MSHGIGVWLDPNNGQVIVAQSLYVACEVAAWLASTALGLISSKALLP